MAKIIVSANLNLLGNAGQFETDRSTWGFSDGSTVSTRSATEKKAGNYSCYANKASTSDSIIIPYEFAGTVGKKYAIKAWVFVPLVGAIAGDASEITFTSSLDNFLFGLTEVEHVNKTVLEAKGTWVEIEIYVEATSAPLGVNYQGSLRVTGALNTNGKIYVDDLRVFEYIDGTVEPETCDVTIDDGSTTVVDETTEGAADGSIDVEATSADTIEYSKDGSTWQLAALFSGLTTGIYLIRARQQALISCVAIYPFAVNFDAVTHAFTALVTNESISGLHDGSISIDVTGTGGPFEFSIDAGVTWQAGNSFTDLAPGTYYVAVRNAAGNSVVEVVELLAGTIEFDKIYHSKNPITAPRTASPGWELLTNYRVYNEVRVEEVADSGDYNVSLKTELPPTTDGNAVFYLQEAFRGLLTLIPPTQNEGTIKRLTDRIKRFRNYSGDLVETNVTPGTLTPSVANLVIWGGIDKFNFPDLNYFLSYLPTNKKFLTWAPVEKVVDRLQEDYLNFYVYGNFTSLKLQIKAYFDDATNETAITKTLVGSKYSELYQLPAGPTNSGATLINPAKNLVKYELSLLSQSDSLISEVRTYYINQVLHPLTRYFMFVDSLGCFQVLRFTGEEETKVSFTRDVVQKFLPHDYSALDGEFAVNSVARTKTRSISSGFVKGRLASQWHDYLQDFIGSPKVFDVTNGNRYPVVVAAGDFSKADRDYNRFIRVEMKDAYDNIVYTPDL